MTERLRVSELFYSIQGESTRAGLPCLFIRLAGCNLRCSYCDARYTWEDAGTPMESADILAWVERYPGVMVEITGGEPLVQTSVYPLLQALIDAGREVLLETNGSLPLCDVPEKVGIIMDIKCPDSGMTAHRSAPPGRRSNPGLRRRCGRRVFPRRSASLHPDRKSVV